jgi:hypothetical protein
VNAPQSVQSHFATIAALAIGATLEGGQFAGLITLPDGKHVAVVLLPNKSDKRLRWADAMAWATEVGGQLPSRPVAALLFANLRGEFEKTWHWTNETHEADDSCAWGCSFLGGYQGHNGKSSEGSARAVRLIHITD